MALPAGSTAPRANLPPLVCQAPASARSFVRGREPSNAAAEKSAVDANVRASHVTARAPACQEYARADQIARLAEFGHRRVLQYRLRALGRRPIVIEKKCSVLFRRKKSGRDRIDAHAATGTFARQESGKDK